MRGRGRSPASAIAPCCASRKPARTTRRSATHRAASSRSSIVPSRRVLGIYRALAQMAGGRLAPDRQETNSGASWRSLPAPAADAQDGDLVAVEGCAPTAGGLGLPTGARSLEKSSARLKGEARGEPDRHPMPHGIPNGLFSVGGTARGRGPPGPRSASTSREDLARGSHSSPSIHQTPRITMTPCMRQRMPTPKKSPAVTSIQHCHPRMSPTTCGRVRRSIVKRSFRGNSVYFPPIAWYRCCRNASPTTSVRYGSPMRIRAALAVRIVVAAERP